MRGSPCFLGRALLMRRLHVSRFYRVNSTYYSDYKNLQPVMCHRGASDYGDDLCQLTGCEF